MRTNASTLISIITPCLNRAPFIAEAIDSVLAQNYPNFEHIIMDGGSTDGTLEILTNYPHLKVFSGQDSGMYEALNSGLNLINGEVVGFLNSDDLYSPGAFNEVVMSLRSCGVRAVLGGAEIFSEDLYGKKSMIDSFIPQNENLLDLTTIGSPFFNAWFFKRELFDEFGNFNSAYKIVADRDLLLRMAIANLECTQIQKPIYCYRKHPGSMTFEITDEKLAKIIIEHIALAEYYQKVPELPIVVKNKIKQIPCLNIFEMVIRLIKRRSYQGALKYIKIGMEHDKCVLLRVFLLVLRRFIAGE